MVKIFIEVSANYGEKWKRCEKAVSRELEKCFLEIKHYE